MARRTRYVRRVGVNWLPILIVVGLFGIAAILARTVSTELGAGVFVAGFVVMGIVGLRRRHNAGGHWPAPWAAGDLSGSWEVGSGGGDGGGGGGGD